MDGKKKPLFVYDGRAYRQGLDPKVPWIISFVAPAEQVLKWAGIPRRSDDAFVGFQRAGEEVRILNAKKFFEIPENQSPTSLIVGVHEAAGGEKLAELEFLGDLENGSRPCRLSI